MRVARQMDGAFYRGGRLRGAPDRDRPAVHRSLELVAKRRGCDRPEFSRERFSFYPAANRLGREPARFCGDGISGFAISGGAGLPERRRPGMDRADPGRVVVYRGAAVFLRASPEDFWRSRGGVGDIFLRVRAPQYRREPRLHAGYAFAQPGDHRTLFFPAMAGRGPVPVAGFVGRPGFACVADQTADGDHRRAVILSRFSKGLAAASPGRAEARPSDAEFLRALGALVFRGGRVGSVRTLVLARASDRDGLLSLPLFWRGRFSDHESGVVLGARSADGVLKSDPGAFCARAPGRSGCRAREICASVSLVVGCRAVVRFRGRLWQSPSMVSTSAGPDRGWVCRVRLRLDRGAGPNSATASCAGRSTAGVLVRRLFLLLRSTALSPRRRRTSEPRSGTK